MPVPDKFIVEYKDYTNYKTRSFRQFVRGLSLDFLSFVYLNFRKDSLIKPRVQFLYIHHVFNDEIHNLALTLKWLKDTGHTFITYSEGVEKIINGNIDKPYIVLSSDDGFKNNLNAIKILKEFDTSCCFFVNPLSIGMDTYDEKKMFCSTRLNFPPIDFLNWHDVLELIKQGFEIGSHTMSHKDMAMMTDAELEYELTQSKNVLEEKTGKWVTHFAFPYGRDVNFSEKAMELVYKTGYKSCATAKRGIHNNKMSISRKQLLLKRDHIIFAWKLSHIKYFILKNAHHF